MTDLTLALLDEAPRQVPVGTLRKALFNWSVNTPARASPAPDPFRAAADWIEATP